LSDQQPNPRHQPPSWAQQPPQPQPQWGAPQPPQPPTKHRGLKIALGVIGGIVALGVITNLAHGKDKTDDTADKAPATTAPAAPATTAGTPTKVAVPAAKPKPKPKPPAKPKTVLTETGHGIKNTVKFSVDGDWDLQYTYNCSSFGMQGNFAVTGMGGDFPDVMVNELGMKGTDVTHQHDGGTMYLQVNSECSWTIKVIDLP